MLVDKVFAKFIHSLIVTPIDCDTVFEFISVDDCSICIVRHCSSFHLADAEGGLHDLQPICLCVATNQWVVRINLLAVFLLCFAFLDVVDIVYV